MSLVSGLASHAQGLCDLLPRPALVNRTFHRLALHAVGEPPKPDHSRNAAAGLRGSRACLAR